MKAMLFLVAVLTSTVAGAKSTGDHSRSDNELQRTDKNGQLDCGMHGKAAKPNPR